MYTARKQADQKTDRHTDVLKAKEEEEEEAAIYVLYILSEQKKFSFLSPQEKGVWAIIVLLYSWHAVEQDPADQDDDRERRRKGPRKKKKESLSSFLPRVSSYLNPTTLARVQSIE